LKQNEKKKRASYIFETDIFLYIYKLFFMQENFKYRDKYNVLGEGTRRKKNLSFKPQI